MDQTIYMKEDYVNKHDALPYRWSDDLKPFDDNEVLKMLK